MLGNISFAQKKYKDALSYYNLAIKDSPELQSIIEGNLRILKNRMLAPDSVVDIDIVIPVYNALTDVVKCIDSVSSSNDGFRVRMIIVNDGSDIETTTWLKIRCKDDSTIKYVEHIENLGYTRAVNSGLKLSTAKYVITQNSDTIVSQGWLKGLIECIESDANIGVVGPLSNAASWQNVPFLRDQNGNFAVNDLPDGLTISDFSNIIRLVSKRSYPSVPFLNGFCYMIKREVIDSIGYMDEINFPVGYGEENDYCIRVLDAGFKLVVADNVYVYHSKSKSFGHERRVELSKAGNDSVKKKHTSERFYTLLESMTNILELNELRDNIQNFLKNKEKINKSPRRLINHKTIETIDMHGTHINLSPEPVYAIKGYDLEQTINGPVLMLPFDAKDQKLKPIGNSIGVHLHLFYVDLLDEFVNFLKNIDTKFSLYVSIVDETNEDYIKKKLNDSLPNAIVVVKVFPNIGRDIGPFLAGFGDELVKHDLICHIHSKRSLHNLNKLDWRRQLLVNLLGSKSIVSSIFSIFSTNKGLGLIYPEYHHSLRGQISWGTNFDISRNLASKLGLSISESRLKLFPAGSMFWARSDALSKLFNLKLGWEDFPVENAQVDGTIAHAVERLFGEIVVDNKFDLIQVKSSKPHDLISYYPHKWPFRFANGESEINSRVLQYKSQCEQRQAKTVVYSAMTGGYEDPVVHEYLNNSYDYKLFTDSPISNCGFWEVKRIDYDNKYPVRRARYIKTNPHKLFKKYDYAIWVDANLVIRCDLDKYLSMAVNQPDVALFAIAHPHRNCIYEEAKAIIDSNKDSADRVIPQVNRYKKEGFPVKFGLIETNLLIINMRHPKTAELFQTWSDEIEKGSHRDQLSLNYALWKTKAPWHPIFSEKICTRDSFDFAFLGHGKNSGYPKDFSVKTSKIITPE